jgi:hypothetical protein
MAFGTVPPSPSRMAGRPTALSCRSPPNRCAGYCVSPGGMASGTASPSSLGTAGRSAAVSCESPWDRRAGYCVTPGGRPSVPRRRLRWNGRSLNSSALRVAPGPMRRILRFAGCPDRRISMECRVVPPRAHHARGSFGDIHSVRYRAAVSASNGGRPEAVSCGSPGGIRSATVPRSSQGTEGGSAVSCGLPLDRRAGYCALPGGRPSGTAPPSPLEMVGRSTAVPCVLPPDRCAGYCVSPGVMPAGTTRPSSLGIPGGTGCMFCVFSPDRCTTDCASPPVALWALLEPASFRPTPRNGCQRRL